MRIVLGALVFSLLGCALGVMQVRWWEPRHTDLRAEVLGTATAPIAAASTQSAPPEPVPGRPHLVPVNGTVHNFGVMARDTKGSHKFVLKNDGDGPLSLHVENTTCKCTLAEIGEGIVPPGATTEVHLEWDAKGYDDEFRHGATLKTNDPTQPTVMLTIEGRIMHVVRAIPDALRADRITVNDKHEFQVRVYGYRPEKLLLHSADFTNTEIANRFEMDLRELTAQEVAQERDAQFGYNLTIRILPGLPMGTFKQSLRLTTNYEDMDLLEIPIMGTCASDISILGPGYMPDTQVLHWGVVEGKQGGTKELYALVRGPHRDGIKIEPAVSDPPGIFRVEVGEPQPYNQGNVMKLPITIHIDPGHDPVSRLAGKSNEEYGRVELHTNHPDAPEIKIYVRFGIR